MKFNCQPFIEIETDFSIITYTVAGFFAVIKSQHSTLIIHCEGALECEI